MLPASGHVNKRLDNKEEIHTEETKTGKYGRNTEE
jgi:hypothetical protein